MLRKSRGPSPGESKTESSGGEAPKRPRKNSRSRGVLRRMGVRKAKIRSVLVRIRPTVSCKFVLLL